MLKSRSCDHFVECSPVRVVGRAGEEFIQDDLCRNKFKVEATGEIGCMATASMCPFAAEQRKILVVRAALIANSPKTKTAAE